MNGVVCPKTHELAINAFVSFNFTSQICILSFCLSKQLLEQMEGIRIS